jgi:hypothetical protein
MQNDFVAFVEVDDDGFVSLGRVTGAQLALAVKRAAKVADVEYYRALLKLQRAFRRTGGTESEIVGQKLFVCGIANDNTA